MHGFPSSFYGRGRSNEASMQTKSGGKVFSHIVELKAVVHTSLPASFKTGSDFKP
jgi:hypothetical protein